MTIFVQTTGTPSPTLQLCDKTKLHCQTILNGSPVPSPRLDVHGTTRKTSTLQNLKQPSSVRNSGGQAGSIHNINTSDVYGDGVFDSQHHQKPADELYLNCKNIGVGGGHSVNLFSVVSDHCVDTQNADVHSTEDGDTETAIKTWLDNTEPAPENGILEQIQV